MGFVPDHKRIRRQPVEQADDFGCEAGQIVSMPLKAEASRMAAMCCETLIPAHRHPGGVPLPAAREPAHRDALQDVAARPGCSP